MTYAYCEPTTASSTSPWHIRPLGPRGLRPSGGADTTALCGREVSWDIPNVPVEPPLTNNCCKACATAFEDASNWEVFDVEKRKSAGSWFRRQRRDAS